MLAMMRTHKAFLEEIKDLLEENGAGHLFKAIKEVFYKYIDRITEKQQTGGGLSAGEQGKQDDGGPAYNVGRQDVTSSVWSHKCDRLNVITRKLLPGRGRQEMVTRKLLPGRGRQEKVTRKLLPGRGCQEMFIRKLLPGRGRQDVAARWWLT